MSDSRTSHERSLVKGLAAGLVAGVLGVVAKTLAERMFQQRAAKESDLLARRSHTAAETPGDRIHWEFGAVTGAAYGALAEFYPAASAKEGAAFGMALETLTHEIPLPALGISLPIGSETTRERVSGMT